MPLTCIPPGVAGCLTLEALALKLSTSPIPSGWTNLESFSICSLHGLGGKSIYAVVTFKRHMGSGLTLAEAFHRIIALTESSYVFHRGNGVMRLTVHHLDGTITATDHSSPMHDDTMARVEIMRAFVKEGHKGFRAIREPLSALDFARIEYALP